MSDRLTWTAVDGFGTVDDAIAEAAKLAKLDPAKVRPLYIEKPLSSWKQFFKTLVEPDHESDSAAIRDPWSRIAARPDRILLRALADAHSVLMGPAIQVRCLECANASAPISERDRSLASGMLAWLAR